MKVRGLIAGARTRVPARWRATLSPAVEYVAAPVGARRGAHRFVIVCGARTGSELLRDLLDSLADVRCEGELLHRATRWPLAYLNGRVALGGRMSRAWGCKIIDSHLIEVLVDSRPPGAQLLTELVADGWTIIHLRREDLLAQALSVLHAMQGQWHFRDPASAFERFEADPAAVIAVLYVLDGRARWLDEQLSPIPHTTVSYEDDLREPERQAGTVARLADLLGVQNTGASTDLRAVAPARPEDRITNLPEVVRALQQTRFGSLVGPPPTGRLDVAGPRCADPDPPSLRS